MTFWIDIYAEAFIRRQELESKMKEEFEKVQK